MSFNIQDGTPILKADGFQKLRIQDTIDKLTIPPGSTSAIINVNSNGATWTSTNEIMYCTMTPLTPPNPTTKTGFLFGEGAFMELKNREQMENFRFTTAEAGVEGVLNVQFFTS